MKKKNNHGFAFVEFIFIVICVLIALMIIPNINSFHDNRGSYTVRCKANLNQLGKALMIYQLDFGKHILYPQRDGQGFLLTLYREDILVETQIYVCPSTFDSNNDGADFASAPDLGDDVGPVSYAGRKNADQTKYPGVFMPGTEITTTPLACDDFSISGNLGTENHENGNIANILFLDGHVDHIREKNGIVNNQLLFGQKQQQNNLSGIFHPLTN